MKLSIGKLPPHILEKCLNHLNLQIPDASVHIGPVMGQDNAIIDFGDQYLVIKSDPITFATDEIGYYAISINANDISLSGARPQWFTCTLLIPQNSSEELVEKIFSDIGTECRKYGISVIGGHTEVTTEITRPIISGTMFGLVSKDKLITTLGGKPGDVLLLTRGIAIEGVAIICREKESFLLEQGVDIELIKQGQERLHNPGICIIKDMQFLTSNFNIHAAHDPTEGGLAMGAVEMAANSDCGLLLNYQDIPILFPTKEICTVLNIDPLGLISSGCALLAVDPSEVNKILSFMKTKSVPISVIGYLTDKKGKYEIKMPTGEIKELIHSTKDELTKIW